MVPQGGTEGSLTGKNVFSGGNYQIGGGTSNQSATYYDGVPVNDGYGNIVALIPAPMRFPNSAYRPTATVRSSVALPAA